MIKLPIQEEHVSVRRTYLLLMKALLDLLAEMPFEKISLTDLCRVSMISRSTFYRYFEDKYDLLHYCVNMYIEGLRPVEDLIYFKSTDSLRQFLEYLIAQVDENYTLYRRIYQTTKRLPDVHDPGRPGEDPHRERLAGREPGRSVKDPAPTLCFVYVKLLSDDAKILFRAGG